MQTEARRRVSVYAVVVEGGRMLLTRLGSASPVFEPGLWHLPGGGVDSGEQPVEALEREVHEEAGLVVESARLTDARCYTAHRHGVHWELTALFYEVAVAAGRPAVREQDGTTAEVAWVPLEALGEGELSPAAADAVRAWRAARGTQAGRGTRGARRSLSG